MTARYRAFARDVHYRNIGELPDYAELRVEIRFNDVGAWHLTASADSRAASLLAEPGGIIITRDNLDGTAPQIVFSGPVTDIIRTAETIEVAGASDELLLVERLASPDPTADGSAGEPYATEYDLREGTASTVLLAYVNANTGAGAITRRQVSALTLAPDPGLGSYIYGQARWIGLLALLQNLALAGGGLRFQILQSGAATGVAIGEITFSVSQPVDRTGTVVISQGRKTLGGWQRTFSRPTASYVYVLGQGQGINRQVIEAGDGAIASTYGRYAEMVVDRRDTNDVLTLQQERSNVLAESGEVRVVAFTPLDAPGMTWGADYDLGDLVTVITPDGETLTEVVRGVNLALSATGTEPEVRPIISTPGDTANDPASRQERAVGRRVSNLERNIDSLASVVAVQWNVGDYRETERAVAAPGWLFCDGSAVSRVTYDALFGVIGTRYGAGDGSTTFNLPDRRGRVAIGASTTYPLGSSGGAATVDASHTHTAGTYAGPSHTHAAGTLTGPAHTHGVGSYNSQDHTHGAGSYAGPSHTHAAGTYATADHSHSAGTYAGPSHDHAAGSLAGPSHSHAAGSLAGPSHTHSGPSHDHTLVHHHSHSHSGTTDASGSVTDNLKTISPEEADASNKAHTHTFTTNGDTSAASTTTTSASGTGDTGAAGTGGVTGTTAADGTGGVTGSTGSSGTGGVTGTSAASGALGLTGGSAAGGTGGISGSSSSAGAAAITGSSESAGNSAVTGSTASDGTGAVTGTSAQGGSTTLSILPPYLAVNVEIYAGV